MIMMMVLFLLRVHAYTFRIQKNKIHLLLNIFSQLKKYEDLIL